MNQLHIEFSIFILGKINLLMIFGLKNNTFRLKNLKILRFKVIKIFQIWIKHFCEYGPR